MRTTSPSEALNSYPVALTAHSILHSEALTAEQEEIRRLDDLRVHRLEQIEEIKVNEKKIVNKKSKCCGCLIM